MRTNSPINGSIFLSLPISGAARRNQNISSRTPILARAFYLLLLTIRYTIHDTRYTIHDTRYTMDLSVRFMLHGDWGWTSANQTMVAQQMADYAEYNQVGAVETYSICGHFM
jgi:hypothetical protein